MPQRSLESRIAANAVLIASMLFFGGCSAPSAPASPPAVVPLARPEPRPSVGATQEWMLERYGRPDRIELVSGVEDWLYDHPRPRTLEDDRNRAFVCTTPNFFEDVEMTHLVRFDASKHICRVMVRDGGRWRTIESDLK